MNQEHLWHLDQMMPGTHFFNMPYVYQLSGELNVEALEKTLKEIIRRHEALRTVFSEVDGRPVQVIKNCCDFELIVIDLRGESADEVSQRTADRIVEERQGPFNLARGPLITAKLVRLTETDYLLLATMHHIISDHWSMQIFRRELCTLYEAFSQGRPSPLPEPTIQFADYVVWERRILDSGLLEKQLTYWTAKLTAPLPHSIAGTKRKRLDRWAVNTSQSFKWDGDLFEALKVTAHKHSSSLFVYFLSALNIFFHAVTRQEDIRIATLVSNRSSPDSYGTIGHFANTVVLRTQVFAELSIEELLERVRVVTFAAYGNQELPFESLAQVLERQMRTKRGSLSSILVLYDLSSFHSSTLPGITIAPIHLQELTQHAEPLLTAYDLTFRIKESSTQLTGTVNYKKDSWNTEAGPNFTGHLASIVMWMMSGSGRRSIGSLPPDINCRVATDFVVNVSSN